MLLSFKSWSKSLRTRSRQRRGASRSNIVGQTESLERRELLSATSAVEPVGTLLNHLPVGVDDEYTVALDTGASHTVFDITPLLIGGFRRSFRS